MLRNSLDWAEKLDWHSDDDVRWLGRVLSRQTRRRLLAAFPALGTALFALRSSGLPLDVCRMIVWGTDLYRFLFHAQTEALRHERILMLAEFWPLDRLVKLNTCIFFETRLLRFETGRLRIRHLLGIQSKPHAHDDGTLCLHRGLWSRVRNPDWGSPDGYGSPPWGELSRISVLESAPQSQD